MEAILQRASDNGVQTLGTFQFIRQDGQIFVCKSLERSYKDNQRNISCIPAGEYKCVYTRSKRLSDLTGRDYFTYEILDVVGRYGIRIHSANYFHQLNGCIALGDALKDLNIDGQLDVIHSGATIKRMEKEVNYEPFDLTIYAP